MSMRRSLAGLVVAIALTSLGGASAVATAKPKAPDPACVAASAALVKAAAAASQIMAGTAGELATTNAALKKFAARAPKEIRGDLNVVAKAYAKLVAALKEMKYDPASGTAPTGADLTALTALGSRLRTPKVGAASTRLQTWFMIHCGSVA